MIGRPRLTRGRRGRTGRRLRTALAAALAAGAITTVVADSPTRGQEPSAPASLAPAGAGAGDTEDPAQLELGRRLFEDGCSSCHGFDLEGIEDRGPGLRGVGEASADFYLRTGRMPLDDPEDQPVRAQPAYDDAEREAIVAYIGRFGGPRIPPVDPERGDLAQGLRVFTDKCAGCHQVVGQGGITAQAVVPDLQASEPIDIAEAIEVGPYVMPRFADQLSQADVDALAAYILSTRDPDDEGGWGIGNIGPIPEGMVAWLLAGAALLLVIRLIGERTTE